VALIPGILTRWTALVLALESLAAVAAVTAGIPINVEFRLAALAGLVSLALLGPQSYALDVMVPQLASWSGIALSEPARKAA